MTFEHSVWAMFAVVALALLAGLFALYDNPLMEIYLSTWLIC